jgi:hypothetical protein
MCKICGDEHVGGVIRFWSPDDGWVAGRLCAGCKEDFAKRKPKPGDYAYDKRGALFDDEEEAISEYCG